MNFMIRFGQWLESRRVVRHSELMAKFNVLENYAIKNLENKIKASDELSVLIAQRQNMHEEKMNRVWNETIDKIYARLNMSYNDLEKRMIDLMANQPDIPQRVIKEFALLNARMDRIELYVGLKRDPQPQQVPDTARIK